MLLIFMDIHCHNYYNLMEFNLKEMFVYNN